jgi:predicted site-specific integrase-resolvase
MPDGTYLPPSGYTTMAQAAERLGISMVTLRARVKDEGLEVYRDPRNKRVRLLKDEELERLSQPVLLKTAA